MNNFIIPADILEIIDNIIIYEESKSQEQIEYDEQLERAYIYDEYYYDNEREEEKETIIEIQF